MNILTRKMTVEDWPEVVKIYEEGLQTSHATFQSEAPAWADWDAEHLKTCRLVALSGNEIAGWAALSPVSDRCVYGGVAEVSVYVATAFRGQGIGRELLQELVRESEANGLWTLQAGIFPENVGSIRIHEHCGFRLVGRRERIGQMNGIWRDTLMLERRSAIVGIAPTN